MRRMSRTLRKICRVHTSGFPKSSIKLTVSEIFRAERNDDQVGFKSSHLYEYYINFPSYPSLSIPFLSIVDNIT